MSSSTTFSSSYEADQRDPSSAGVMSSVSSFFSNFFPVVHAEEEEGGDEGEDKEEGDDKDDGESEGGEEEEEEDEDDDEPEDPQETIYAECESSKACAPAKHHFEECQERVQNGKGFKGEDCIEEFFHLAHCAAECTAPKLFKKLV